LISIHDSLAIGVYCLWKLC